MTYRIAHISDLHLSLNNGKGRDLRLIELLEDIKKRECDHIVITGDLADNPIPEDLIYAREIFAQFELMKYDLLSVVPGNHDIYGSAPPGEMMFMFPKICSEININEMQRQFIDTYKEIFPEGAEFPYVKVFGNVALIGINSLIGWSVDLNPEGSNGGIDEDGFEKLEKILKSEIVKDKVIIVLIHHHFSKPDDVVEQPGHSLWINAVENKMKFHDSGKFLKLLKKRGVNLVLHGHTHYTGVYVKKGITFVNSSACSIPLTDDRIRKYNIISIPEDNDEAKKIGIETIQV